MSKPLATYDTVSEAIHTLESQGRSTSADAILKITGGNKGTVLRLRETVMAERSQAPTPTSDVVDAASFPSELNTIIHALQKPLKQLPEVFAAVIERRLAEERRQSRQDILLATEGDRLENARHLRRG